jgi:hypothetical protein
VSRTARVVVGALVVLPVIALGARARAQGAAEVATGVTAYEEGDFEAAEAAFDRALAAGGLTRGDLVRVLAHRLLLAHARGETERLETLALRLASLDPEALGDAMSPELERVVAAAAHRADGVVRLEISHEEVDGGLAVRARVRGDVGALVETVRLRVRVARASEWVEAEGGIAVAPAADPGALEVVAEAVGPAGVVLAAIGSESEPARLAEVILRGAPAPEQRARRRRLGGGAVAAIVVAAAVVVGGAVALGVVFGTAESDRSQVGAPVVEF